MWFSVTVLSTETSEANDDITIGVGLDHAPWKYLVREGKVTEVPSLTDDGAPQSTTTPLQKHIHRHKSWR